MSHYKSNVRDIEFNLFDVLGRDEILGVEPYADLDRQTVSAILAEVDHLAATKLAESFADGDGDLPVFDPQTHTVTVPEDLKKSFRALMDSGAWQLELPEALGEPGQSRSLTAAGASRASSASLPLVSMT